MKTVLGSELKVGDTIEVWWSPHRGKPNRDVITKLVPYTGKLAYLFPKGAQLADFMFNAAGMTIDNDESYNVEERG